MWILLALSHANPVQVSAGAGHSCLVDGDGTVKCWGGLAAKDLREGKKPTHLEPATVDGIAGARSVSAGGGLNSCAVLVNGDVWCWKVDEAPARIDGLKATEVSVGEAHACARNDDGAVWCWGFNSKGQLGDGSTTDRTNPVRVEGIDDAAAISAGWYHTCALHDSGGVSCWGYDNHGQLGRGAKGEPSLSPVRVKWLEDAIDVDTGCFHTCAVRQSGQVVCWGAGGAGQLGDGTRDGSPAIVAVPRLTNARDVAAGLDHACAVRIDGSAVCWGNNEAGQVGNEQPRHHLSPMVVEGLDDIRSVSVGSQHSCFLLEDDALWCTGQNFTGQLGDGTTEKQMTPVKIAE